MNFEIGAAHSKERADILVALLNKFFRTGYERRASGESAESIMLECDILASAMIEGDNPVDKTLHSLDRDALQFGIEARDRGEPLVAALIEHEKAVREQLKKLAKKS
jgi:hypothetical protein